MSYSIETVDLTKDYGGMLAVDRLNLCVDRGSFFGFLGPNGAGKSTTIKMLTGIIAPTRGRAVLLGRELASDSIEIKRRIGVLPEEQSLFESLTGREYLTFIGRMYSLPAREALRRGDELLELFGLAGQEKTLIIEYSQGMKKKLAFAAALIHNPEMLFLDEPFEGIDPISSRTIREVLDRLMQRGCTIFLTSHILEIVERLCTHVGIIRKGALVCQGTLAEVAAGVSLEAAFVAAVGAPERAEVSLSWLQDGA